MNDIILKADNLYFSYDDEQSHSLNGLSLEIKKGKKIAFMGANGSGKSTFFLCCNGIHKPSRGTLYFNGKPVDYSRQGLLDLRSKVGIVFQDPDHQLFSASVYQEISFGILNLGVSAEEAQEEVEQVIEQLEITPFRHKPTHALSGGQKKQVSIADILVMHPDIIILDEPAAALDPRHTSMVNHIVNQMTSQGITVMMATHDVNYAMEWADEIVLLKDGKLLMQGSPEDVFSNKSALASTNLEQPACLQLFDSLSSKGILKMSLPVPKNLSQLEHYIQQLSAPAFVSSRPQSRQPRQAILVVSFGTSYHETRKKTIDAIEQAIGSAFPEHRIYRAWTSKMIMKKLLKRDGIKIFNVKEAMAQMAADGITDVIIQPTHVINGIENELMIEDALSCKDNFHSIRFGPPLLTSSEDNDALISIIHNAFSDLADDEALVLMGHGTTHYANSIYAAMDYTFKDKGYPNIFLGTVEAYPSMETLLRMVKEQHPKKIILTPFMIVAGDHAANDMAGDDPDSWKCQFIQAGFEVECVLKGLGEYPEIHNLFIRHIKQAMQQEPTP
ncbi:Energy-coupling factor transporter ATP-binding protein EcfA 1 [uncultured Roseburia sp.]|nr:Energy-coupling factor transporter ATP-binding protein EcfA 1 [uncultured Roseburia sp.]